jgi:hypothetical protein
MTPGASPSQTPTHTPTMTKTPTMTPTQTPTNSMTPTPTPTTKTLFYAYIQCGGNPLRDNVIIQPVPALPGNVIGDVVLNNITKVCWELIKTSTDLGQLEGLYVNHTTLSSNYFVDVYPTFTGSSGDKPCDECAKYLSSITPVDGRCNLTLINTKNCAEAATSGMIYVNGILVYQFGVNFPVSTFTQLIPVLVGDVITIKVNSTGTANCVVQVSDTYANGTALDYTSGIITNNNLEYTYKTYCGLKKEITILSTCETSCPGDLIFNPKFTNNLNSWVNDSSDSTGWGWSSNLGGSALFISSNDQQAWLSQDILTVGATYNISFDILFNNLGFNGQSLKVYAGATEEVVCTGNLIIPPTLPPDGLSSVNLTMVCTTNTTFKIYAEYFNNPELYVTNVCVTKV